MIHKISDDFVELRSDVNPWMDCIFAVEDMAAALPVLQDAWHSYWDQDSAATYTEHLAAALEAAGISYELFIKAGEEVER